MDAYQGPRVLAEFNREKEKWPVDAAATRRSRIEKASAIPAGDKEGHCTPCAGPWTLPPSMAAAVGAKQSNYGLLGSTPGPCA